MILNEDFQKTTYGIFAVAALGKMRIIILETNLASMENNYGDGLKR